MALLVGAWIHTAHSADLRAQTCGALAHRVDAIAGPAPVLLRSWDDGRGEGAPREPALKTAAFVYDDALATIALVACGKLPQATRVGRALSVATMQERVRNAYRDGAVEDKPVPNGWWDDEKKLWAQDPYQMGSATGNVAWVALAMLTLHQATGDAAWLDAAARCGSWVLERDRHEAGGFTGGVIGLDGRLTALKWKSTEHNIDLVAVFAWLSRARDSIYWKEPESRARRFVASQWDPAGRFFVGTGPDGATVNHSMFALDTQLWPSLLSGAPAEWSKAIDFAGSHFAVRGGFDFNDDRDGLWVEGTAQAALAERRRGHDDAAKRLLEEIAKQASPGGFLYATREARITTGLSNDPASAAADFYYYRRPHLGATAWAALAAIGWNPFVGAQSKTN